MSDAMRPAIVWFRDDLRLGDNPALCAAAQSGRPIVCVYVYDEETPGLRPLGGAARWWLSGSLSALNDALGALGGYLLILRGAADGVVLRLASDIGAVAVFWNRRYDRAGTTIDARLKSTLKQRGVSAESFNGHLLREPWTVTNKSGAPYRVFGAYWRASQQLCPPDEPLPAPTTLSFAPALSLGLALKDLALEPRAPDWSAGMRTAWTRGEAGALDRLESFVDAGLKGYADARDRPDLPATSRLSPHLRFGEISARQVWTSAPAALASGRSGANERDLERLQAELGWREFSYHILHHQPDLAQRNLQARFDAMPWRRDPAALAAWRRGRTGYPLVDAGMRELWTTGWMHNRVRMVVASFLVKHLLIDWREGEAWFWDTLVDADPANNPAGWQWVAGSGADAAPYFRVFNPTLQGEKFDPDGGYVRHWVPELARLSAPEIHRPWTAKSDKLAAAGVRLGESYPLPIVDHGEARQRALAAFATIRGA